MSTALVTAIALFINSVSAPSPETKLHIVHRGSRRNHERPNRRHTRYIILHTTEGAEKGALEKLSRDGEAHYLIGKDGTVYRIVNRRKVAAHTGLAMWEGRTNLDEYALSIEVAGYHDDLPTPAQIKALRRLLRELQSIYKIPDNRVLTHSMVAYGTPNRWHRHAHRGRKRCAMHLASPEVRRQLGLKARPRKDPDVSSGRLIVADKKLHSTLYPKKRAPRPVDTGRTSRRSNSLTSSIRQAFVSAGILPSTPQDPLKEFDTAQTHSDKASTKQKSPADSRPRTRRSYPSDLVHLYRIQTTSSQMPSEAFIMEFMAEASAYEVLGDNYKSRTTVYLFPDGLVRTGAELSKHERLSFLLHRTPKGTRVLQDYFYGGYITPKRSPQAICGHLWNQPQTLYRFPDGILQSGDRLQSNSFPPNTMIFFPAK